MGDGRRMGRRLMDRRLMERRLMGDILTRIRKLPGASSGNRVSQADKKR